MVIEARDNPQHPEGLTVGKESLILALYDLDAIRFGEYRWKVHDDYPEAPLLPIYTNFRMLTHDPKAKSVAVDIYQDLAAGLKFDLIAGIPTAATPFAASLSDRTGVGHITPRMDSKTYGSGDTVDGFMQEDIGKTVLLLDDLKSFFGSKDLALKVLRAVGLLVTDVVIWMDYQLGDPDEPERHDVKLHSAFTARQMLDFSLRAERIPRDTFEQVLQRFNIAQAYFR